MDFLQLKHIHTNYKVIALWIYTRKTGFLLSALDDKQTLPNLSHDKSKKNPAGIFVIYLFTVTVFDR